MKKALMLTLGLFFVSASAFAETSFESSPTAANPSVVRDIVRPTKIISGSISAYFIYKRRINGEWIDQYRSNRFSIITGSISIITGRDDSQNAYFSVSVDPNTGRGVIGHGFGLSTRMMFESENLAAEKNDDGLRWMRTQLWVDNEYIVFLKARSPEFDEATEYLAFVFAYDDI